MLINIDLADSPNALDLKAAPKEMISIGAEKNKILVRLNSSSLGVIQECLRKAKYSLHENLRVDREHPATLFGSAMHSAMEVFYTGAISERKLPDLGDMEFMAYGNKLPDESPLLIRAARAFLDKAKPLHALPDTDKRSLANGVWILHSYFRTYIDDPYVAYVDESGPFIERKFTLRLHEDNELIIDIFGTIDFVLQHAVNRSLIPGDHKTTSSFGFNGSSYFDREKPNHQYTFYALGARRVFGIESDSFMVNMIEVKARPKTSRGSPPSFPRQLTQRTEEDFDELHEVVLKATRDYLDAIKLGVWPMGPVGACSSYGACTYREICSAPKSMRENIIRAKFNTQQENINGPT